MSESLPNEQVEENEKNNAEETGKPKSIIDFDWHTKNNKNASTSKANDTIIGPMIRQEENKKEKVFKGFYLDAEVSNKIDELRGKAGKNSGSQIVNDILKLYFKEHGYL